MLGKFSGVESERTISKFRKRNFVVFLPTSTKRAREIKNIHVAVVQRRLRKGVMYMQSCRSANLNLFLFLPFLLSLPSSRNALLGERCVTSKKTAAREIRSQGNMTLCLSINYAQICA